MTAELPEPGMLGGWVPCPMDTPCGNCGHPMIRHFGKARVPGYDVACGECRCDMWWCRHGGHSQPVAS